MPQTSDLRVVLGLMIVGPEDSPGARLKGLDNCTKAFDIFQERGYNEVDTARLYLGGKQEAFTREAKWKERNLKVATKAYPIKPGLHEPDVLATTLETSLAELGTDCVDIFYLHAPDRSVPFEKTLEAVDKLHKAGKFKRLGLSNYAAFEVAEIAMTCAHRGFVRPTIYQAIYNCLFRHIEEELIPACRRYGISIDAYSPIGGGFLSGAITSTDADPREGRFAKSPMQHFTRGKYFRDGVVEGARIIREAAEEVGIPPLEAAMRWIVHHSALRVRGEGKKGKGDDDDDDERDGIVIGFSSLVQLKENLDSLEKGPLPESLLQAIDRAWRASKADADTYWQLPMVYTYDTQKALFGGKSWNML